MGGEIEGEERHLPKQFRRRRLREKKQTETVYNKKIKGVMDVVFFIFG